MWLLSYNIYRSSDASYANKCHNQTWSLAFLQTNFNPHLFSPLVVLKKRCARSSSLASIPWCALP